MDVVSNNYYSKGTGLFLKLRVLNIYYINKQEKIQVPHWKNLRRIEKSRENTVK